MAQVILPFLSVEAWGKFGNGVVYERWKGVTRTRRWVKPRNPKSTSQAEVRTYFMAASHLIRVVDAGSVVALELVAKCPRDVAWQAFFIGAMIGDEAQAIKDSLTAWDTAGNQADFNSCAASLGLEEKRHSKAEIDAITAGEVLFIGARAAYRLGATLAPVDAQDMSTGELEAFVGGFS